MFVYGSDLTHGSDSGSRPLVGRGWHCLTLASQAPGRAELDDPSYLARIWHDAKQSHPCLFLVATIAGGIGLSLQESVVGG